MKNGVWLDAKQNNPELITSGVKLLSQIYKWPSSILDKHAY